jgi:hypothetical protein
MVGIVSWNFALEREKPDDDYGWLEWVIWEGIPLGPVQLSAIPRAIDYLDSSQDFSVWLDLDSS